MSQSNLVPLEKRFPFATGVAVIAALVALGSIATASMGQYTGSVAATEPPVIFLPDIYTGQATEIELQAPTPALAQR